MIRRFPYGEWSDIHLIKDDQTLFLWWMIRHFSEQYFTITVGKQEKDNTAREEEVRRTASRLGDMIEDRDTAIRDSQGLRKFNFKFFNF